MFIKLISDNKRYTSNPLYYVAIITIFTLNGCQTTTGMQPTANSNHPTSTQYPNQTTVLDDEIQPSPSSAQGRTTPTNPQTTSDNNAVADDGYSPSDAATAASNPKGNADHRDTIPDSIDTNEDIDFNAPASATESEVFTSQPASSNNTKKADKNNNNPPNDNPPNDNPPNDNPPNDSPLIVTQPEKPSSGSLQQMLIEQARQNSRNPRATSATTNNGDNIPAFRRLMSTGITQLKQGRYTAAQSTFTRAQRLAPQSSAVYFYLGQVALKKKQYLKAEAMARRGLVVANSSSRKKSLWQLILKSAQLQGNQRVIKEAQLALSK